MTSRKRQTKYYGEGEAQVWPEDHPKIVKPKSKKDTKKWCKGKVGREHVPELTKQSWANDRTCAPPERWMLQLMPTRNWRCYHQWVCANCGKVLDRWLPARDCPDRPTS